VLLQRCVLSLSSLFALAVIATTLIAHALIATALNALRVVIIALLAG
jgi:hypothetical protein